MGQQQHQLESGSFEMTASSPSVSSGVVRVESIDGDAVELQVSGSETVSDVRRIALETLGSVTDNPAKYIVIDAQGRVVDDNATIDQLGQQMELDFQLLPQAAFGPGGAAV